MTYDGRISCLILGGGGHARVLIDCMWAGGSTKSIGVLDSDPSLWGKYLRRGVPILARLEPFNPFPSLPAPIHKTDSEAVAGPGHFAARVEAVVQSVSGAGRCR